jgi:hypothetical protein
MATSFATLRSKLESDLRGRVASPFTYRDRNVFDLVSTGIPEIDSFVGGLPRGAMTEVCGSPCSGRTSLLLASLAKRTANGEVCALVDARDSFDPLTGNAAGMDLKKLLWVRCRNLDQALRATDLLIQAGGFGMVAVDLSDVPAHTVRQVPLNAWFRFRRAVEDTPTILLLLEQESHAKTCASLVLRLQASEARWRNEGPVLPGTTLRNFREAPEYPYANLLCGFASQPDIVRSRIQMPQRNVIDICAGAQPEMAASRFETKTIWSFR